MRRILTVKLLNEFAATDGKRPFDALGLGEVMLRLSPSGKERINQGQTFEKTAGGSELNVVSGISILGRRSGMITKLPATGIGEFINHSIRFCGVSDDCVILDRRKDSRLGVYYYESGAFPRKSTVIYDRTGSAFTTLIPEELPKDIFSSTRLFHTSGITLALGGTARDTAIQMIRSFKDAGALISFDVNYRANLWTEEEARSTITSILPYVDIFFVSEESSRRMFGKTGTLQDIMRSYTQEFGARLVCTTQREVITPNRHNFTSVIYSSDEDAFYTEKPYRGIEIVDRLGSGDAYVGGVLFALLDGCDYSGALRYGNDCSAVKNTVLGDLPASDRAEIEHTIFSHQSGAAQSEMNR